MPTMLPLDRLKEEISARRVVAVVGTGVSIAATQNHRVASWKGLLHDGLNRCCSLDLCSEKSAEHIRAQIDGDLVDLLCAAENIAERLGAPDGPEYAVWLEESVGTLRVVDRTLLEELIALDVPILTTNYDGLIEEMTGLRAVTWRDKRRAESVATGRSDGVLHMHGHWEQPESVVLGVRSYGAILADVHAQNMLRAIRTMRTLVFVGFGDGLRDPNFGGLLRWAGDVFAESAITHFRLCLRGDYDQDRTNQPDGRISLVPYGTMHNDLPVFLRSLRDR
jgi:hypothetical protein